MIKRKDVASKLLAYLNEAITLAELVDWAENAVAFEDVGPDEDIDLLMDVLMYLAGADSAAFPLTWDVSVDLLRQLGMAVRISAEPAAA